MHKAIIAIDFDNTIARVPNFPVIKGLVPFASAVINKLHERGWFIIINTCRSGEREKEAVAFLKKYEIPYNLINENHPGLIEVFGDDCRKISADMYVDDKNASRRLGTVDWIETLGCAIALELTGESMLNLCK